MKIKRLFTTEGEGPYHSLEFEKRSSVIRNPDGSVVAEWENVTVPEHWSQVASDIIKKGKILSVDILEMENIRNVNFLKGDFFSEEIFKKICNFFNNKVDVVISDMAANTSGNKNLDSYRTGELCMNAMDLAKKVMHKDGVFVSKVFMGSIFTEIDAKAKKNFKKVVKYKPLSS